MLFHGWMEKIKPKYSKVFYGCFRPSLCSSEPQMDSLHCFDCINAPEYQLKYRISQNV